MMRLRIFDQLETHGGRLTAFPLGELLRSFEMEVKKSQWQCDQVLMVELDRPFSEAKRIPNITLSGPDILTSPIADFHLLEGRVEADIDGKGDCPWVRILVDGPSIVIETDDANVLAWIKSRFKSIVAASDS